MEQLQLHRLDQLNPLTKRHTNESRTPARQKMGNLLNRLDRYSRIVPNVRIPDLRFLHVHNDPKWTQSRCIPDYFLVRRVFLS